MRAFFSPPAVAGISFGIAVVLGLLLIVWALVFAKAAGGRGMERPYWGTQFYGYSVCIIAVIVFLFSFTGLLGSIFEAAAPLRSDGFGTPTLTSFEAYRATYQREQMSGAGGQAAAPAPSEDDLRRRYEALRDDRLAGAKFNLVKSLISDGLLLAIALALFRVHWRLAGRAARLAEAAEKGAA